MNIETKHLWSHKCPKKWDQYTLIALVITIVILIILAGVAISLTLGNNGLFNKVKEAKEKYLNAQENEETEISTMVNSINYLASNSRSDNQKTITTFDEFSGTVYDNTNATSVEITDLTIGKKYLVTCFRSYTGGKNAYVRNDLECYTCSFTNTSSLNRISDYYNNYIMVPSATTVVVNFPEFSASRYGGYGACPYVFVFEI